VLRPGLTAKQQTLFLLYHEPTSVVLAEDLYSWVEYDQLRTYRRDVLSPLHDAFDRILPSLANAASLRATDGGGPHAAALRGRACDENVDAVDFDTDADIVGITGFVIHKRRM